METKGVTVLDKKNMFSSSYYFLCGNKKGSKLLSNCPRHNQINIILSCSRFIHLLADRCSELVRKVQQMDYSGTRSVSALITEIIYMWLIAATTGILQLILPNYRKTL